MFKVKRRLLSGNHIKKVIHIKKGAFLQKGFKSHVFFLFQRFDHCLYSPSLLPGHIIHPCIGSCRNCNHIGYFDFLFQEKIQYPCGKYAPHSAAFYHNPRFSHQFLSLSLILAFYLPVSIILHTDIFSSCAKKRPDPKIRAFPGFLLYPYSSNLSMISFSLPMLSLHSVRSS